MLDICDYLAYCLDDPETTSVILFVEGFKRPERFLALADRALGLGKPIMAVKVGRSQQAQVAAIAHSGSLAGEARVTDAALDAAGVIRCGDLDELLETAELVEGMRRTGRRVGRGRTGVVTVSTGEGSLIADLAPITGVDLPTIPPEARSRILEALPTMGYIGNPLDPWGAADPPTAYGVAFEALADSGAYDVLVLVHDFPYRSAPSEVATANDVTLQLLAATRDRPSILPVYVSLTSGEPPPETKAVLDELGAGAPLLRGAIESFRAIASVARWESWRERRGIAGPWRAGWPALAAGLVSYGADQPAGAPFGEPAAVALSELESLDLLRDAGLAVVDAVAAPDADAAVMAAGGLGSDVALKLDVAGLAHKSDIGGVALGLRGDDAVRAAATRLLDIGARDGRSVRGLLVDADDPGRRADRRPSARSPVRPDRPGGVRRHPGRGARRRCHPACAAGPRLGARRCSTTCVARPCSDGVRGRPPVDRDAIASMLVVLGRLGVDRPDILEVDLNPVMASATGATRR